jgi:hypothetical protein
MTEFVINGMQHTGMIALTLASAVRFPNRMQSRPDQFANTMDAVIDKVILTGKITHILANVVLFPNRKPGSFAALGYFLCKYYPHLFL